MLTELLSGAVVYVVTGYTDMRKGIDGLAQIVEGTLKCDVYSKAVYLFCGRNSTKMKALVWDGDGFLLLYKRLDNGRYRWPRIYRIEQDMKDHGAMLSRTTMANWIIKIAEEKAKPVYEQMKAELLSGRIIHADETVVRVLHEAGRSAKAQSRMWVYCSPACSKKYIVLYDYRQTRGGKNAVAFLGNYDGYVVCDGYDGYNRLTQAKRCGCFVHVRRKFVEALPTDRSLWSSSAADQGVRWCDRLFALEREYDGKDRDGKRVHEPLSPEEKHLSSANCTIFCVYCHLVGMISPLLNIQNTYYRNGAEDLMSFCSDFSFLHENSFNFSRRGII